MNRAERQRRRAAGTSDLLIVVVVGGLGLAISMGSDLARLGSGTEWQSFRDFWERSSATAIRISRATWSSVPKPETRPSRSPETEDHASYSVRPGDTLSRIAETHSVALSALVSINRIKDPDRLDVSQTLLIPGSDRTPSGTETQDQRADSKGVVEIAAAALDRLLEDLGIAGWGDGFVGSGESPEVSAGNPMSTNLAAAELPADLRTVDGLLAKAEDEILSAYFQNALETSQTALRLLELEDDPLRANPRRARFEISSAIANIAFGRSRAARLNFERALESDPDLVLDSARNSPKVLRVFVEACLNALPDRELACQSSNLGT